MCSCIEPDGASNCRASESDPRPLTPGVSVNRLRYFYTALGGALIGIGGAAFSLDVILDGLTGRLAISGWIVLAIVIFGGWHPLRAAIGVLLFGALQAYAIQPGTRVSESLTGTAEHPVPGHDRGAGGVVNWKALLKWLDRYPFLRVILRSDPPTAIGTRFEVN